MLDADILCRCLCRDGSYMATEKLTRKIWYGEVRQRRFLGAMCFADVGTVFNRYKCIRFANKLVKSEKYNPIRL